MSRESMMLLAGGAVLIAFMVYTYENQHAGVRGVAASKYSATAKMNNLEQTDADNNAVDQIATGVGKSAKTGKTVPSKPPIIKVQFVAFDAWPTASNTCPNQPAELLTQDANQEQQAKNGDQNYTSAMTPQSVLNDELKSTSELYKGLTNQLAKQNLNVTEYNSRIRALQREYDEKIKNLFQKKQKLNATQKLMDNGSVSPEEGNMMMWRLVLPQEAIRAMSSKPKAPAPKPTYGTVTGIIYNNETPLATIDGEIYREGASIHGVRIAKINRDSVEFENKGLTWSQNVNEPPSPNWP